MTLMACGGTTGWLRWWATTCPLRPPRVNGWISSTTLSCWRSARSRGASFPVGRIGEGGGQVRVRSDSAAYDQTVLDHWTARGWTFAVSADMTPQLRAEIVALPPEAWHLWAEEAGGFVREWAEVPYVPSRVQERRDSQPYRYLAIRIRPPQGLLFGDGSKGKHYP